MKTFLKGNSNALEYKTVFISEGNLYEFTTMQPAIEDNSKKEFMLTNDNGVTKWHHEDWFDTEIICEID